MTKKCFKCNETKDLRKFYKHKGMSDGHLGKCKDCTKKDVLIHRSENIDKIRAYDRDRAKLPHRKKMLSDNCKRFRKNNPMKYHAHSLVASAIKCGRMIKGDCCVDCGENSRVVGHHADYYKPLEVEWLCQPCHAIRHK